MPRYRPATPRATDRKLLSTTADILAVVPGEGSSFSTMPITRSRILKPVPVLVSADTAFESSVMVFLNDVHQHRASCNYCIVLIGRNISTGSLLAADTANRHDQPDRNLTGGQRLRCELKILMSQEHRRIAYKETGTNQIEKHLPASNLSVCPEMIFRLRKPLGNKATNSDCPTGRKTSLFSNFFENLDNNNLWLWQGFAMEPS